MAEFTFDANNYLFVTSVGSGGGGTNVNVFDSAGNALTSTAGSLNVNVTGGTIVASNPSVGLTGVAAPTSATEVGGVDSTGKLRAPTAAVLTNATALAVEIVDANGNQITTFGSTTTNITQVAGVTLGSTAVTNFGTAPAATAVPGVNASIFAGTTGLTATGSSLNTNITNTVPVTLTSTTITNTVAENLTQVAGVVLGATAVTAYGTAPAAANVPGVNAFITNTPAVTLASTTITGNVTVVQPTGTNLHVVVDSGSALTASVTGTKSNNAVVPGATNLGVLPGIANAATQVWTEGDQVLESMDLSGRQRMRGTLTHNNAAPSSDLLGVMNGLANAVAPTYTEGDIVLQSVDLSGNTRIIGTRTNNNAAPTADLIEVMPAIATTAAPSYTTGDAVMLSTDLTGQLRVTPSTIGTLTNNNAAPGVINLGVLPALANAASPAWTEGNQVLESVDLTGRQRIRGTLTNNNAAPAADQISVLPALANAAAPTWTEGDQVLLSEDLAGNLRVKLSAGAATIGAVTGTLTNNNAAPAAVNLGALTVLANAANPAWTEGDVVFQSADLSGRLRTQGQVAADAAFTGNPVVVAGVDSSGNVQELPVADQAAPAPAQVLIVGGKDGTANAQPIPIGVVAGAAPGFAVMVGGNDGAGNSQRMGLAGLVAALAPVAGAVTWSENSTTAPSLTNGQAVCLQSDYTGSVFVKPIRRSSTAASKATITNSGVAVTVMPAQAAGIFADISHLSVTVTPAASVSLPFTLTLSDGTATYVWDMETGALATSSADGTVLSFVFNPPIPATTAATAWTVLTSVATVVVHAVAVAILQKAS